MSLVDSACTLSFKRNVFINCPFDSEYLLLLKALLFTVVDCGFQPRIALEKSDASETRIDKIKALIRESCYSIHDVSRMEGLRENDLPRFNMPFELGLDLGCKFYGSKSHKQKCCLILERERYRYQKVLSDISGNDIEDHNNDPQKLVNKVRNWLKTASGGSIPEGRFVWTRFNTFHTDFVTDARQRGYTEKELSEISVPDFLEYVQRWKMKNPL